MNDEIPEEFLKKEGKKFSEFFSFHYLFTLTFYFLLIFSNRLYKLLLFSLRLVYLQPDEEGNFDYN